MSEFVERLERCGVVPVVEIGDATIAPRLAAALAEGGLDVVEITLRNAAGLDAIRSIAEAVPEVLVGAGTLLTTRQLTDAVDAGARFGVSPGHDPALVEAAAAAELPYLPGVATPSEVQAALRGGVTTLKLFPAGVAGGPAAVRALAGPFRAAGARFVPTGGVREADVPIYLGIPDVVAVGGSWLTPAEDIAAGRWAAISRRAADARAAADAARAATA